MDRRAVIPTLTAREQMANMRRMKNTPYEQLPPMPEDVREADRDGVLWSIQFALMSCSWKLGAGSESAHVMRTKQEHRQKGAAEHILKQLEMSGYRIGKGPPRKPHG